jgi:hypothetical protein
MSGYARTVKKVRPYELDAMIARCRLDGQIDFFPGMNAHTRTTDRFFNGSLFKIHKNDMGYTAKSLNSVFDSYVNFFKLNKINTNHEKSS